MRPNSILSAQKLEDGHSDHGYHDGRKYTQPLVATALYSVVSFKANCCSYTTHLETVTAIRTITGIVRQPSNAGRTS